MKTIWFIAVVIRVGVSMNRGGGHEREISNAGM
jgi:hypothetical protein